MKYIMIHKICEHDKDSAVTYPIIFPNELNHCDVSDQIISLLKSENNKSKIEVVSAGFFNLETTQAYGHSETLGLNSRDVDDLKIRFRDYYLFDEVQEPNKRIK